MHRDLKPENILLESDLDLSNMKIIGFGSAAPFNKDGESRISEVLGSPFYVAPEVINRKYNEKCDIWSIGVITFMLISGKAPFHGDDDYKILESVKLGKFEF